MSEVKKGVTFHAVYADSNSKWEVKKHLGGGAWLCEIKNDPIQVGGKTFPGEYNGVEKSFLASEIQQSLLTEKFFVDVSNDNEKFLQSQKPGTILHYHNGFGQYVRRVVVRDGNVNKLKPIALVGNWEKRDLPQRYQDGNVYYPFHANKILAGELDDRLQSSTTYEHPNFSKPMGNAWNIDPRKLDPISLEVPPLEGDAKVAAELWQLVENVQSKLNPSTEERLKEGNSRDPATPMKRLRAAYELLATLFGGESED